MSTSARHRASTPYQRPGTRLAPDDAAHQALRGAGRTAHDAGENSRAASTRPLARKRRLSAYGSGANDCGHRFGIAPGHHHALAKGMSRRRP